MLYDRLNDSQKQWVNQRLEQMNLKQKVGQLFCPYMMHSRLNAGEQMKHYLKHLINEVQDFEPAGYYLNRYYPATTPTLINMLQESSPIPLLIGADMEEGAGAGLGGIVAPGFTQFPNPMGIGATGSERYAYLMGKHTALQARALGVNYIFAPSLDVSNNPDNPIINTRSFGEDPERVARLGCAFINGIQDHNVAAAAKHFPGHGDTSEDSHILLSKIAADRSRLEAVELLPFRTAIERTELYSIMTAHLAVPALEPNEKLPATLSSAILQNLLRQELGFDGIIITDALLMGGITQQFSPGEAAVKALQAGADLLLMPPDFQAAFYAVCEAVEQREISQERIQQSLLRILSLKAALDLHLESITNPGAVFGTVEALDSETQSYAVCSDAVTLVRNEAQTLPLNEDDPLTVLTLFDTENDFCDHGEAFHASIEERAPEVRYLGMSAPVPQSQFAQAQRLIDAADTVVFGLVTQVLPEKGTVELPEPFHQLIDLALQQEKQVVLVSFGNPYLLRRYPEVHAYLCAYSYFGLMAEAVTEILFGERIPHGRLPVTIPGVCPRGTGIGF